MRFSILFVSRPLFRNLEESVLEQLVCRLNTAVPVQTNRYHTLHKAKGKNYSKLIYSYVI